MKKWAKLLTVPLTLAMLVACGNEEAGDTGEETAETEETTEVAENSEEETEESTEEETDADSNATESDGGWTGSDAESSLTPEEAYEEEDLESTGEAAKGSTIDGVDM